MLYIIYISTHKNCQKKKKSQITNKLKNNKMSSSSADPDLDAKVKKSMFFK